MREQTHARLCEIETRLSDGDVRMDRIETALQTNTDATLEMRDILQAAKGAFKVLGWLGIAAKWIGGFAAAAVAIWQLVVAVKTGDINIPK